MVGYVAGSVSGYVAHGGIRGAGLHLAALHLVLATFGYICKTLQSQALSNGPYEKGLARKHVI
eukprot:356956-Chlamydomonas_euryale.AAC.5